MKITKDGIAVVDGDTHLSKWIEESGTLEVARGYLDGFRKYIPDGGSVVDIGACLGDHTATYARFVGPNGAVLAFEPNPVAYECLSWNMRPFPWVATYPWALGCVDASVSTDPDPTHNLGANKIKDGGDIRMMLLDDVFLLHYVDFIKIDAEGWETEIIDGAMDTIRHFKPVMLIEVNRPVLESRGKSAEDLVRKIESLGYSVKPADPSISMTMDMVDVLCLPI